MTTSTQPVKAFTAVKIMSFETFAAQNGASRQDSGDAWLHRSSEHVSAKSWKKIVAAQAQKDRHVCERRTELRKKYEELVASGEIKPPSSIERLRAAAQWDGPRGDAARRLLAKKEAKHD